MTKVGALVEDAFSAARAKHQEVGREWVRVSHKIGAKLPASKLGPSIQRDGELDLLIRCLEDEVADVIAKGKEPGFAVHRLIMLSEYWIGAMYETFRLLRQRKLEANTGDFAALLRDFELVRMPLEKHELATDEKLKGKPLALVKYPATGSNDEYVYKYEDPTRAHIMPRGGSERGSVKWHVIDVKENNQSRWIERRGLSDRALALWE